MLSNEQPYFFKNEEWFYYDGKTNKFYLTDKAPEEARKSYEEFYNPEYHFDSFDYGILKEAKQVRYADLIKEGKTPEEAQKECDDWWNSIINS